MKISRQQLKKLILEALKRRRGAFQSYGTQGRHPTFVKLDRAWKRRWNSLADHEFFKNKVLKIHWVGAFGSQLSRNAQGYNRDPSVSLVLDDIKKKLARSGGKVNKDELSTVGYHTSTQMEPSRFANSGLL